VTVTRSSRPLVRLGDLTDGTARGFDPDGDVENAFFVVRQGEAAYAYRDRCPHQGARLPWRRHGYLNRDGSRIVCYAHGAEFDVASGRCLLGPCLGQSLTPIELDITEQGEICFRNNAAGVTRP
jgi:nitrite reductase/ring-hydroxylating ferredoxin subunit